MAGFYFKYVLQNNPHLSRIPENNNDDSSDKEAGAESESDYE